MKKFTKVLALCLVSFMALTACGKQAAKPATQETGKKDDAKKAEVKSMKGDELLAEQKNGAVVIDVRSDKEFAEGHIKDAKNLFFETIEKEIEKVVSDKNAKVILYCNTGKKSGTAADKLVKLGYTNVYNAEGVKQFKYDLVK